MNAAFAETGIVEVCGREKDAAQGGIGADIGRIKAPALIEIITEVECEAAGEPVDEIEIAQRVISRRAAGELRRPKRGAVA